MYSYWLRIHIVDNVGPTPVYEMIYADYAPSEREAEWVEEGFRQTAPEPIDTHVTN